jgi:hypothetical protein
VTVNTDPITPARKPSARVDFILFLLRKAYRR